MGSLALSKKRLMSITGRDGRNRVCHLRRSNRIWIFHKRQLFWEMPKITDALFMKDRGLIMRNLFSSLRSIYYEGSC